MSDDDIQGIEGKEARPFLDEEIEEIRLIKDRLDAIFEQQKQRMDDLDVLFVGYARDQKTIQESSLDALKVFQSEQKKILEEIKSVSEGVRRDTQELGRIASQHKKDLSSYYDYLYLKVLGIAAMGGLFALFLLLLFYKFVIPFIYRLY
jgi:hypothetical protein